MIKFTMTGKNGRKLIGLGLSAENIKRLRAADPIFFDAGEVGLDGYDVLIMAGDTEDTISADLQKHFTVEQIEFRGKHEPRR